MKRILAVVGFSALAVCVLAGRTRGDEAISYAGRLPDAHGMERDVSFKGTVVDRKIIGTVVVEGTPMAVDASVGRAGDVTGTVTLPNGSVLGNFSGRRSADGTLAVTYDLGGTNGNAVAPESATKAMFDALARSDAID